MPLVHIERRKAKWADRLRAYEIVVDGVMVDKIRNGEERTVELAPGNHELHLRVDWCRSRSMLVEVAEGDEVHLHCYPRNPALAIVNVTVGAEDYIGLEEGRATP